MPKNKKASYRYRLIDIALSNRAKRWTMKSLIAFVSDKLYEEYDKEGMVSERTIVDDIKIMRKSYPEGYDAPIIRKRGEIYYDDPDFSIKNSPLTENDVASIDEALTTLRQFTALPLFRELIPVVRKMKGIVADSQQKDYQHHVVQFEQVPQHKGLEYMETIYKSIVNKQTLRITYHSYRRELTETFSVSPYLLKETNNRWFLIGYAEEGDKEVRIFGLDRILKLEKSTHLFAESTKDWIKKFDKLIGVSFPDYNLDLPTETVRLWVSEKQKPYTLTKPIHHSQRLVEEKDDGSVEIELTLIPNYELITKILAGRHKIKVLSPPSLVEQVRLIYKKGAALYEE